MYRQNVIDIDQTAIVSINKNNWDECFATILFMLEMMQHPSFLITEVVSKCG